MEFQELLTVIEQAGTKARFYFDAADDSNEQKADGSVVTRIDTEIEAELVSYIKQHFPQDSIVGEEGGDHVGTSSFVWHIDPIDGTDNFLRRIPFCGISVARLSDTAEDSFGIVHNPITGQTFASLMEDGVYENTRMHTLTSEILGGRAMLSVARGKAAWMKSAGFNIRKAFAMKFGGREFVRLLCIGDSVRSSQSS